MRRLKKILALTLSGSLMLGFSMSANAAGLKDVFNAKYYADQYSDLKMHLVMMRICYISISLSMV